MERQSEHRDLDDDAMDIAREPRDRGRSERTVRGPGIFARRHVRNFVAGR